MPTEAVHALPSASSAPAVVARLRRGFASGRTRDLAWRKDRLQALLSILREREADALEALRLDFGKPALESYVGELGVIAHEIDLMLTNLHEWSRPEPVSTPLRFQPGTSFVQREPLGTVLVMAAWNYPLVLALGPLVGAIAAGNTAAVKPSEMAPNTAELIANWVDQAFEEDEVAVYQGGIPETTALLEQRFDHIFFTGSTPVGKIVMRAASEHLTPVTLELGGKCPCIVDESVDIQVAAKRIAHGRFWNAGQTCFAPDYVLADRRVLHRLRTAIIEHTTGFYGPDPQTSPDYARIVNRRHFDRLVGLLKGEHVVHGGQADADDLYIAPTVLSRTRATAPVMQEEIFGPILPILSVEDIDEAIAFVNARPKPLALYAFGRRRQVTDRVLAETSSGGAAINEVMAQASMSSLPFGGVGDSGMGRYHGRDSFETFSNRKAVLRRPTALDFPLRYPPYRLTPAQLRWLVG